MSLPWVLKIPISLVQRQHGSQPFTRSHHLLMLQIDENLIASHVFEVKKVMHWRLLMLESRSPILYLQTYIHEVWLFRAPRCIELK